MRTRLLTALLLASSLSGCVIPLDGSAVGTAGVIPPSAAPGAAVPPGGAVPGAAGVATSLRARQPVAPVAVGAEKALNELLMDQAGTVPTSGVVWLSSNAGVATVNPTSGQVRGVAAGTAVITATLQANPAARAQITVVVTETLSVTDITVTPPSAKLAVGGSQALTAAVKMADGTINANVTWRSSDESVATVSKDGAVKARREGQVTIEAVYAPEPRFKGIAVITVGDFKPTPAPTTAATDPGTDPGTIVTTLKPLGKWVAQSAAGAAGRDIEMLDAKTGYLANNDGGIQKTTDGGATWTSVMQEGDVSEIRLLGDDVVVALGGYHVWRSADAGATWTKAALPYDNNVIPAQLTFVSGTEGYVLVSDMGAYTYYGNVVFHTRDAGVTWEKETLPMERTQISEIVGVDGVQIATTNKGIWRHAGEGWEQVAGVNIEGGYFRTIPNAALAVSGGTVWCAHRGGVLRSTDKGKNWTNLGAFPDLSREYFGLSYGDIRAFGFTDATHGYIVWSLGFAITEDGGKTWRVFGDRVYSPYLNTTYSGGFFADAERGWVLNSKGEIIRYVAP